MDTRSRAQVEAMLGSAPSQLISTLPASTRSVHRAILQTFADTGAAPTRTEIGDASCLEELDAFDLVGLDDVGAIAYAYPFSARPTAHRVQLAGGVWVYAMCAIDALGIPAMLGTAAVITSQDPRTGEPITVTVTDHGATPTWQPGEAVVFVGAWPDCCSSTAAESCCGFVNFFVSHHTVGAWTAEHPEIQGVVLERDQALDFGQGCFGDLLER